MSVDRVMVVKVEVAEVFMVAKAMGNPQFHTGGARINNLVPEVPTLSTMPVAMGKGVAVVAGDPTGIDVLAVVMARTTIAKHNVATVALASIDQGLYLL